MRISATKMILSCWLYWMRLQLKRIQARTTDMVEMRFGHASANGLQSNILFIAVIRHSSSSVPR